MIAHTLRASGFDASEDGTGRGTPLVATTLTSGANGRAGRRQEDDTNLVPSVMRMREGKDGGGKDPLIRDNESLTLATSNDQTLFTVHGEHSTAMTGGGDAAVAFPAEAARSLDTTGGYATNQGGSVVGSAASVRRLTPRECERLQGFPDDWTCLCAAPHTDDRYCADGSRYAALGNAVTVNAAEWVIGRVVAA